MYIYTYIYIYIYIICIYIYIYQEYVNHYVSIYTNQDKQEESYSNHNRNLLKYNKCSWKVIVTK